jgi:sugar phosphate isomerase/epimerase
MNEQRILEELLALLESNGVTIRYEPLGGSGGGLCAVKGEQFFFVDTQAAAAEMVAICADAVTKVVDIEKIYIRPEVRQFIEKHRNQIA